MNRSAGDSGRKVFRRKEGGGVVGVGSGIRFAVLSVPLVTGIIDQERRYIKFEYSYTLYIWKRTE